MMGANVSNGEPLTALELFREMQVLGVPFDSFTFPCVLKACGVVEDMRRGAEIHGLIIKRGYDSIVFVANSLVSISYSLKWQCMEALGLFRGNAEALDVYVANALVAMDVRFDKMSYAARIYDKLDAKDIITWNSMLAVFTQNGLYNEALQFFCCLQEANLKPDEISFPGQQSAYAQ
uniref:Pentacotripeptide-repeat region of PRORP domain-containing protein n=1 Tax=Salix viminalis TaxID=40686 RepID=A0A6N2LWB9_SALVM